MYYQVSVLPIQLPGIIMFSDFQTLGKEMKKKMQNTNPTAQIK